ncbi:MAG: helix-turn-helix transcriptional regulator [Schleiferilactobacillus harbinensis]|jgi:DNA-binding XRE family transcriptional regulator|nr:helix-turn-helix transcriptional regulator [Schleiferilactobacillus harbinensis]MCI1913465.1 helix-turn-helix transcriptional regulator [Schleiferilactobacillus harbinensis]
MGNQQKNAMPAHSVDELFKKRMKDPAYASEYTRAFNDMSAAWAITEARHAAGLTQKELALKAHLPQATVARVERGNNTSINTLSKMANALGKKIEITIR